MIDLENKLFDTIAKKVRGAFPNAYITGEYVNIPSQFPCITFMEMDNSVVTSRIDSGRIENAVNVMYEVNVYSNKIKEKKTEAKQIMELIDQEMLHLGFVRTLKNPVPNEGTATIFRMFGRYTAMIDKDYKIGR